MKRMIGMALLALVAVGCNSGDAKELTQDAGRLAKTAGKAAGNAQVAIRVNAALANRKGVDMSGLHVESDKGVVTIGGHVRNAEEKKRVLETARDVRGVEKVIDKLRIEKK
ncbi:MAG: BON domain-containing protein [Fimbriimonas sp.]